MGDSENLLERIRAAREAPEEPSEEVLARRELAAELRTFIHALGSSGASPAHLRQLAAQLRAPRHTPVATLLRVEARLVSVDDRKIRTEGEISHGDLVVAQGSGLFIAVDTGKFAQLAAARSERVG